MAPRAPCGSFEIMASDRLVLDASFALESVLPTSAAWQREAWALLDQLASEDLEAAVPWLFYAEIAAACAKRVRSGILDAGDAADFIEQIDALPLQLDLSMEKGAGLYAAAMRWQCGTYDAIYLAAAAQMRLPIATRDKGMIAAARVARVPIFGA